MGTITKIVSGSMLKYVSACRRIHSTSVVLLTKYATVLMLLLGVAVLTIGVAEFSAAQIGGTTGGTPGQYTTQTYGRFSTLTNRVLLLIEGPMGALVMVAAGLLAIISAAFGAYRAAVGLLVVAVGAFVLRSLVSIFFSVDPNVLPTNGATY